jgi:hypothetical protein
MLKGLLSRLFGGGGAQAAAEAVEYEGYLIRPAPFASKGQYQTCGTIEKELGGELKQYQFIRAEAHPSRDQAIEFSIAKAKQIIDEQGDRIFRQR